jgi:hypothetical protein
VVTLLTLAAAANAAVTGTVVNKTTGKPQAGATVVFNKLDPQLGITFVDQAKSGADGSFTINQEMTQGIPYLIRTAYDGVTYNHMLPPGSATAGLTIEVYNSSKLPGAAKVSKHMLMFEPSSSGQMQVAETFLVENNGQTAWNDPGNGTVHFYLPAAAGGKATAQVLSPGSMPIGAPVAKTSKPDVFEIDYPVKPGGETRFDVTYSVPYSDGDSFAGKIVTKDDNTYLISPNGVTLTGDGLNDLGQEPKTQAHIYGLPGDAYKIALSGAMAAAASDDSSSADSSGGPQIEAIMPRLYDKAIPILAVALSILALGFALLYRAQGKAPAKESNERGRG